MNKKQIISLCRQTTSVEVNNAYEWMRMPEELMNINNRGPFSQIPPAIKLAKLIINSRDEGAWGELTDRAMYNDDDDDYSNHNYIEKIGLL